MKLTDERRTHWFWMDNEAIDLLCAQLGSHAFATYAALARMANAHSRIAFPSIATLAKITKMNRTTIMKATKTLETYEILRITPRQTEEGDRTSNEYFLTDKSEWTLGAEVSKSRGVVVLSDHGSRSERPLVVVQTDTNNTQGEQDLMNNTSKSHSSKKPLKPPPPDEIQLVREVTLKYPPKDLWPAIERKVKGKTKEQVGACYEAWRLKGYSPTNFAWLEWLDSGIPQNGYHKPPSKDPTVWPSADLLIDLYNELTPDECPAVDTRSPARLQKAEACLALIPDRKYWVETFKQVGVSSYLRGKKTGQPADFDWILAKGKDEIENYVKVHDGRYHD